METELAFEMSCLFKKLNDGQVIEKKMVSLIPVMLYSVFWISWPLNMRLIGCSIAVKYLRKAEILHDSLAMQALVWYGF